MALTGGVASQHAAMTAVPIDGSITEDRAASADVLGSGERPDSEDHAEQALLAQREDEEALPEAETQPHDGLLVGGSSPVRHMDESVVLATDGGLVGGDAQPDSYPMDMALEWCQKELVIPMELEDNPSHACFSAIPLHSDGSIHLRAMGMDRGLMRQLFEKSPERRRPQPCHAVVGACLQRYR